MGLVHLGLADVKRDDALRGHVNEELRKWSVPPVDILVNCAKLYDPDAGDLRSHSGENCHSMMAAYNHPKMERLLVDAKKQFERVRKARVRILCVCLKGKHRSVCVSRILAHVLQKKAIVAPTEHLSSDRWPNGFCHLGCRDCAEGNSQKNRVLAMFQEWWDSL